MSFRPLANVKAVGSRLVKLAGNLMLSNWLDLWNAAAPIDSSPSCKVTLSNEAQLEKAFSPMLLTLAGTSIALMFALLKHSSGISARLAERVTS